MKPSPKNHQSQIISHESRLPVSDGPQTLTDLHCLAGVCAWHVLEREGMVITSLRPGRNELIGIGRAVLGAGRFAAHKKKK